MVGHLLVRGDGFLPTDLRVTSNISLLYRISCPEFSHTVYVDWAYIRNNGLECLVTSNVPIKRIYSIKGMGTPMLWLCLRKPDTDEAERQE